MIKIDRYEPVQRGCVVAEVDITIQAWNFKIRKIQECVKGDNRWFNWPSFSDESGGERKWIPYVEFDLQASKDRLFEIIREKIDEMIEKNPDLLPKPTDFSSEELPF